MQQFKAFTVTSNNGRLKVLNTSVGIADPIQTRYKGDLTPAEQKYKAIWDTGAMGTSISIEIAESLSLISTGIRPVSSATQKNVPTKVYLVDVYLPNGVCFVDVKVTANAGLPANSVLIGMDIIASGDFSVTNVSDKTIFTFRIPSVKTIDYVAEANRLKDVSKICPNDMCPCGSGYKFKHCTCEDYHPNNK